MEFVSHYFDVVLGWKIKFNKEQKKVRTPYKFFFSDEIKRVLKIHKHSGVRGKRAERRSERRGSVASFIVVDVYRNDD